VSDLDLNNAIREAGLESFDPAARILILNLMNKVEALVTLSNTQSKLIQQLRDENARLKGEKGKPDIRPQAKDKSTDISSEKERKGSAKERKKKQNKDAIIKINRTEICDVPEDQIPEGAVPWGFQEILVQDILIETDNVLFRKKVYKLPDGTTIVGKIPDGYEGKFGPNIRAFVITCHHEHRMSLSSILNLLTTLGILICEATISRMLTVDNEVFHQEKEDIVDAGLESEDVKQMDDTGGRVKGKNRFVHILCGKWFTSYFTRKKKDRLTILEIVARDALSFQFDEAAYDMMSLMGVRKKHMMSLQRHCGLSQVMTRAEVDALFLTLFPDASKHQKTRQNILEASGISWYHKQPNAIKILMTDDAPQYKLISILLALCWIHDGRHYKKLTPYFGEHILILEAFRKEYWDYYKELIAYTESPDPKKAEELSQKFDTLFSRVTDYEDLDKRIAMTAAKRKNLLLVLKYPDSPLHNNASEIAARYQAMRRDSNYQTVSENGTQSKDSHMTIIATARKHGVNTFKYYFDRITKKYEMPSLAEIIRRKMIPEPGLTPA